MKRSRSEVGEIVIDLTIDDDNTATTEEKNKKKNDDTLQFAKTKNKKRSITEPLFVYNYGVVQFPWPDLWRQKNNLWIPLWYQAQRGGFLVEIERDWYTWAPRIVFTDLQTKHSVIPTSIAEAGRLWKSFFSRKTSWYRYFGLDDLSFVNRIKEAEMRYAEKKKNFELGCSQLAINAAKLYEEQPRLLTTFLEDAPPHRGERVP